MEYINIYRVQQIRGRAVCRTGAGQAVWKAVFDPVSDIRHTYTIKAILKSQSPVVLSNVLFGDVWICSGQSNMKFSVEQVCSVKMSTYNIHSFFPW